MNSSDEIMAAHMFNQLISDFEKAILENDAARFKELNTNLKPDLVPYLSKSGIKNINKLFLYNTPIILSRLDYFLAHIIAKGDIPTLKTIIENFNIPVDYKNNLIPTLCATTNNVEMMANLISYGTNVNSACTLTDLQYILRIAVTYGTNDMIKLLLESGADPNIALSEAVKGNKAIVELLLSYGADPNNLDAMSMALIYQPDIFRFLVDKGADVQIENNCLLKRVIKSKQMDNISLLLELGADPSSLYDEPIDQSRNDMIDYIISRGVDPVLLLKLQS